MTPRVHVDYPEWMVAPSETDGLLRHAFALFPSGVAALCAQVEGELVGMVVSSLSMGASFDPPILIFAAQQGSRTWQRLRDVERLGVTVLGSEHAEACRRLASRQRDRFAGLEVDVTPSRAAFVHDSPVWLECAIRSETAVGDHQLVLLEVTTLSVAPDVEPLVYHARTFRGLEPTTAPI